MKAKPPFFTKLAKLLDQDYLYLFIITVLVFAFFFKLFYPETKVYITPDVALSDQVHLNLSLKKILADSLKQNRFPWWEPSVANGFPLIGESQIGAFYLPNLILFKFLPFETAFNLGYVVSFLIFGYGGYFFFRQFTSKKWICFFASSLQMFSAPFCIQIVHYNLLQTYSLIPFIFLSVDKYLKSSDKKIWLIVLVFLYSQQFLAGYVMVPFITTIMIGFYYCFHNLIEKKQNLIKSIWQSVLFMMTFNLLSLPLISIQLIPSIEYAFQSTRFGGMGTEALSNSLPINFLSTYINPNIFGSLGSGVFNRDIFTNQVNVFWEANLYIGILPIVFFLLSIFLFISKKEVLTFGLLVFISIMFALGANSPLYIIYLFPVFNFFRTPSRFTIIQNLFILTSTVIGLSLLVDRIKKITGNKTLLIIGFLIILFTADLYHSFSFFSSYHPVQSVKELKNKPIAVYLQKQMTNPENKDFKIYQMGNEVIWAATMGAEGWKSISKYQFMMNDMSTYLNYYFDLPSANLFMGSYYYPKKSFLTDQLIINGMFKGKLSFDELADILHSRLPADQIISKLLSNKIIVNKNFIELLKLKGVRYFITPFDMEAMPGITMVYSYEKQIGTRYRLRVYEIERPSSRFYLTNDYQIADTVDELNKVLADNKDVKIAVFSTRNEETIKKYANHRLNKVSDIKIIENKQNKQKLEINTSDNTLLVSTDTNYTGWQAYIDNIKADVIPVNIDQKALLVPKGKHIVMLAYKPLWYPYVVVVSVAGYAALVILAVYFAALKRHSKASGNS